jgi:hypothetical protein
MHTWQRVSNMAAALRLCLAGTIAYVAPEMLQTGAMGMLADVYSFAMLMLELWKGELVYRGVNTHQARAFKHKLALHCVDFKAPVCVPRHVH